MVNLRLEFTTERRPTLPEIRIPYRLVFYIPPISLSLPVSPTVSLLTSDDEIEKVFR